LEVRNNIFWDIADNVPENIFSVFADNGINVTSQNQTFKAYFQQAENVVSYPGIVISEDSYWLIPSNNVSEDMAAIPDSWFVEVNYKGAFGTVNWADGWTLLSQSGLLEVP
jgi:hypothetical protein